MLLEFRHSYNDFDRFTSYSGHLELRMSHYSAVQTSHILQTIRATRRNGQYIWVSETLTRRLDQSLLILQASLLPFCPVLRNITLFCHGIWPEGFRGVWGLPAPIGLRRRASGRWLVAPLCLACPHAEEEA